MCSSGKYSFSRLRCAKLPDRNEQFGDVFYLPFFRNHIFELEEREPEIYLEYQSNTQNI